MQIENLNVEDIKGYVNNAKIHTPEQIEQIQQSIIQFGFNDPIAVDETNTIIEGHGRLQALVEMGEKTVPCIRITNLTDEQKKAYILVHNKLTLNSGFDFNILDAELAKIKDINMADFGFDDIQFNEDDFGLDFELNSDDKPKVRTITLTLSQKQYELATKCIDAIKDQVETDGICNENGGAVYEIVRGWKQDNEN